MDCFVRRKNIGRSSCVINVSLMNQMLIVPDAFEATEVEAADLAFWQALLLETNEDERGYLFPAFANVEPASEETVYAQTPLKDVKVRDGKYQYRFLLDTDLCTHKNMRTHNGNGRRVIFFDIEGQAIGTEKSNGNFTGLKLSLLNVEKLRVNDGTNPTYSPVYVVIKDNKDLDDRGWIIDGSFVNELNPLTDVTLTLSSVAAGSFKVAVTNSCDGVGISGLLVADFVVRTAAGVAQSVTTAVPDALSPWIYTLDDAVAFVTGTVDLRAPSLLTVKAYEAEAVVLTIP